MSDYWAQMFLIGAIRAWNMDPMWKGYWDHAALDATFLLWKELHRG